MKHKVNFNNLFLKPNRGKHNVHRVNNNTKHSFAKMHQLLSSIIIYQPAFIKFNFSQKHFNTDQHYEHIKISLKTLWFFFLKSRKSWNRQKLQQVPRYFITYLKNIGVSLCLFITILYEILKYNVLINKNETFSIVINVHSKLHTLNSIHKLCDRYHTNKAAIVNILFNNK